MALGNNVDHDSKKTTMEEETICEEMDVSMAKAAGGLIYWCIYFLYKLNFR